MSSIPNITTRTRQTYLTFVMPEALIPGSETADRNVLAMITGNIPLVEGPPPECPGREQELLRRVDDLTQLAYVAAHDLQEPLRMVASYTRLIAERYKGRLDPQADEFLAFAVEGARRMQELVDRLLAVASGSARNEARQSADSGEALAEALANLRLEIERSGATIRHCVLPWVPADPVDLREIFQNLVSNAIKFRGIDPPTVEISETDEGNFHLFSVKDNGVGVPKGSNERIFQMFQRAHKGMGYEGTGIGLAICKKIVERHGGRIWVESDGENGSTFFFTLPVDPGRPVRK
jgi:light-regulated signal transduction histidine kinase (bacteriophytochrome)